ncbi:MAG TPA: diacylglycerol kinase family protein [Saprospiraceae bacterium]|nr:diacylglycerol kinase family protein [Saprospiraceae bacterium]
MSQDKPSRYAVLVNLAANDGRAAARWESIAREVLEHLPPDTVVRTFRPPEEVEGLVQTWLNQGVDAFISAGGDGSANFLLNLLMRHTGEHAEQLWLGGIGLGSSNDFVKPKEHFIQDLPIRLDVKTAAPADVGKAEWQTENRETHSRYFLANASMGVTANANWLFNHGDAVIRFLKKRWTDGAILYAALRSILGHRNLHALLAANDREYDIQLSNLAVLKSPYVSGSFCYDDPVTRNDGTLGINICTDMGIPGLIRVLYGLSKGRFRGSPHTLSFATSDLRVHTMHAAALELDGEVVQCRSVRFTVCPGAIRLMGL